MILLLAIVWAMLHKNANGSCKYANFIKSKSDKVSLFILTHFCLHDLKLKFETISVRQMFWGFPLLEIVNVYQGKFPVEGMKGANPLKKKSEGILDP